MGLRGQDNRGYAMAALLVSLAVMSVLMSAVLPVWRFQARREKEAELVFRGEQYARAIGLFARKNGGAFPPNLDVLVQGRYLRKKYKDPMTEDGEFQPLFVGGNLPGQPQPGGGPQPGISGRGGRVGQPSASRGGMPGVGFSGGGFAQGAPGQMSGSGGLLGVVSKSKEASIKNYRGGTKYNEWVFRYAGLQTQPGAVPGQGMPGAPGVGPPGGRGRGRGGRGPGVSPRGFSPGQGSRGGPGRSMRPPG